MIIGEHTVRAGSDEHREVEHSWIRVHDTFAIEVACTVLYLPPGMKQIIFVGKNSWRLYTHVYPSHKAYKYLLPRSPESEDSPLDTYVCSVPDILRHMHGGVTLKEISITDAITVGCDFCHYGDIIVGNTSPEDDNCLVHWYAHSLESTMLELDGKPPSIDESGWVSFLTLPDYASDIRDTFIEKLKALN